MRAASAHPDFCILQYWNADKQCAVRNKDGGDSLAEFIARELYETFDPDGTDQQQIAMAVRKMREGAGELQAVVVTLENLEQERRRQCHGTH
jgi:hypothetical protein